MTDRGRTVTAKPRALLEVDGLAAGFDGSDRSLTAIEDISLRVEAGECLGIIGESGSGKSVMALALMGLLPRNAWVSGSAWLAGEDIVLMSPEKLRRIRGKRIGYVFQDPMTTLHPLYRVKWQIAEALRVHQPDLSRIELRRRVLELLELTAVPDPHRRMEQYPHELSGGLRQRICIAIAIANRPQLLIADEPTTALDVTVQAHIVETLDTLRKTLGMGLIFISHDLAVVSDISSRIEIFYAGRIVESRATEDVIGAALHPYTRSLIDAVPKATVTERLVGLEGAAPPIGRRRIGCNFAPRCDNRVESLCAVDRPTLRAVEGGRVACHNMEPLADVIRLPVAARVGTGGWKAERAGSADFPILEVRNLSKYYGKLTKEAAADLDHPQYAVRDVSFSVGQGECFGLVGESGCGKSTVVKCVLGIQGVNAGQVFFDGKDISSRAGSFDHQIRRQVQMVFQDPYASLHPRMTVFDNIAEPLRNLGIVKSEIEPRVREAMDLARIEYGGRHRWPFAFSGGQRQRIGIARAIVTRPRLLILDEPVSALDVSIQASILNLLKDLQSMLSLSYVFISHDLGVVNYVADRIAVMSKGRIVEMGTRDAVFRAPSHPFTRALLEAAPGREFAELRSRIGTQHIGGRAKA